MSKSPPWSAEELATLAEVYPVLGTKSGYILEYFEGRSLEAISLKANRLGMRVINNTQKRVTNDEYLETIYRKN